MKTMFEMVREFTKAFDQPAPDKLTIPTEDVIKLRWKLIVEEYCELRNEILDIEDSSVIEYDENSRYYRRHISDIAKEACDLLYVVLGLGVNYGINLDEVFAEVHRSNMSKLGPNGEVLRREDGKVLKSANYTPANVEPIIFKD